MANEDYTQSLRDERQDHDVAARHSTDAWHDIMTALEHCTATDLRVAIKVLMAVGRALQAERNGEPHAYYETALNDAAAIVRDTHAGGRPGRITRIRALADAVEAKELAQ